MSKRKSNTVENPSKRVKIKIEPQEPMPGLDVKDEKLYEKVAALEGIKTETSFNLVKLFEEDNTIPFIARYRKHMTDGMDAEKLRQVKETVDAVIKVEAKAESLLKTIAKEGPVDQDLSMKIKNARTMDEIEVIAAPFKKGSKGTLASRARKEGLEECSIALLKGFDEIRLADFVKPDLDEKKVTKGVQHIIADIIAKDTFILKVIDDLKTKERIMLQCTERKDADTANNGKYDLYKNSTHDVRTIKDHQVLAINRAESQKVLSVKLIFPDSFWDTIKTACREKWLWKGRNYESRREIFEKAVEDAIHRLLSPLASRQILHSLTKNAERSAISVFLQNLKQLLLSPPLRGKVVLAIDPGISHGCKIAIVSPVGVPLDTGILYLKDYHKRTENERKICNWMKTHGCETIAIGNGTYCRETEEFIAKMISNRQFSPLDVSYTIIDEQGVSIYSCSPAAAEEFPNMEPNLISAISIARRLQDPMAELVKVEPKHLGVGMYQHDVPEKKLNSALDEVVSECVSFVGVDLNTASIHLLRRVAGLTKTRAVAICEWRKSNGPFQNRNQLLKIKGIGSKTFRQCAGFVRILPSTSATEKNNSVEINPLDRTEIHPEDYPLAKMILEKFQLDVNDVGSLQFVNNWKRISSQVDLKFLAETLKVLSEIVLEQLTQISESLLKPADYDLRQISVTPLFRKNITTFDSLTPGQILTGVVRNVVHFGAFVDIGVGSSGLIHSSKLPSDRSKWVQLGDKVTVVVISVDERAKKIFLRLN